MLMRDGSDAHPAGLRWSSSIVEAIIFFWDGLRHAKQFYSLSLWANTGGGATWAWSLRRASCLRTAGCRLDTRKLHSTAASFHYYSSQIA